MSVSHCNQEYEIKKLPTVILRLIIEYATEYVLVDYVKKNHNNICSGRLSDNPNAMEILKKNQNKINWCFLSSNPNAIELLKKNKDRINWYELSSNVNSIELLKKK